ncbi:MAG: class I SAM-dependent methyltransferase [Acidobacteria bacterium]|nr:class I SAM-dependent methyltransferase [Acidobacteriota bacterium]
MQINELSEDGRKTSQEYWDEQRKGTLRLKFPPSLFVSTRNIRNILRRKVKPGMSFLEVGFAPGVQLAWVAKGLGAKVSGVDFAENGVIQARRLFTSLGIEGDLRHEDFFNTSFPLGTFDVVYSAGFIEHFDDPSSLVKAHVDLARPGGRIIILIPHYGGIYGKVQEYFHPENLLLHNVTIMQRQKLLALAPSDLITHAKAWEAGKLCGDHIGFAQKFPASIAKLLGLGLNFVGLIQPVEIKPLCPILALEMIKR